MAGICHYEEELVDPLNAYLHQKGWQVFWDIPFLLGRIDVVAFSNANGHRKLMTFELKISDWRKALFQAATYSLIADESYVVLPENRTRAALNNWEMFISAGVGLFSVGKEVVKSIPASEPTGLSRTMRCTVLERLDEHIRRRQREYFVAHPIEKLVSVGNIRGEAVLSESE